MSCPACWLDDHMEITAEMVLHLCGLKNIDRPAIYLFPKLLVCMDCGFARFTVPKAQLELLVATPLSGRLTMAAAG
jgi:hypothetical protein